MCRTGRAYEHTGLFTQEQQWLNQAFNQLGYADAFRQVNKDMDEFSPGGRQARSARAAAGARITIISEALKRKVEYATIYKTQEFSSHLPVVIDYDIDDLI